MQTNLETKAPTRLVATAAPKSRDSEDIDDFIYLISHDVRASVRALLELPQWIKEDLEEAGIATDGAVGSSIDLMNRHTGRLDRMLVDLLAFSRVGRMQGIQTLDMDATLDEVLDEMHVPQEFRITREFDCTAITMGERDLPTMLNALISNAIKHHDRNSGRIHLRSWQEGAEVAISVSDDGPGIDEAFHERVFAPMTTLRPRDEVEGSGMGLAKTRKIARHYGGNARIETSPFGRGISVVVRIAVAAED